jgi:hypothetical protein
MSQFREGSFGRLLNHEVGIPVNSRAARMPDLRGGFMGGYPVGGGPSPLLTLMRTFFDESFFGDPKR